MFDYLVMAAVLLCVVIVSATWALQSFRENGMQMFRRKVGPTYWGAYSWASALDAPNELQINLPEPSRYIDPAYGGNTYGSGKAVKSAKG